MSFYEFFFVQNNVIHLKIDRIFNNNQINDFRNLINYIGPNKLFSLSVCGSPTQNFHDSINQFFEILSCLKNSLSVLHIDGQKITNLDSHTVIDFIHKNDHIIEFSMDDTNFSEESHLFDFYKKLFTNENISIIGRPIIDLNRLLGGLSLLSLKDSSRFNSFKLNFNSKEEPMQDQLLAFFLRHYSKDITCTKYLMFFSKLPPVFNPINSSDDFQLGKRLNKLLFISFQALFVHEPCKNLTELQNKRLIPPDRSPNYRCPKDKMIKVEELSKLEDINNTTNEIIIENDNSNANIYESNYSSGIFNSFENKYENVDQKSSEKADKTVNQIEDDFFFGPEDEVNFETVEKIGEGRTSIVYKIIDKRTNVPLCKKVLKTEGSSYQDLQNAIKEFQVLHMLHHPSICYAIALNTAEIVQDENQNKDDDDDSDDKITTVSILLEFIDYKLKDCIEKNLINNTIKARIIVEISQGLKYIHSKNMIYRDLKLSNIMLNSSFQAKMIDFGLIKINEYLLGEDMVNSISMANSFFDAFFMSPELLKEEEYDNKTDVFSFGIILYYMFVGRMPKQTVKDKIMDKQFDLPDESPSISKFCIELIRKCISKDPKDRPSFIDILNTLRENKYMLACDVDPSIVSKRDQELEQVSN